MGQNASPEGREELRQPGTRLIGSVAYFPEKYGAEHRRRRARHPQPPRGAAGRVREIKLVTLPGNRWTDACYLDHELSTSPPATSSGERRPGWRFPPFGVQPCTAASRREAASRKKSRVPRSRLEEANMRVIAIAGVLCLLGFGLSVAPSAQTSLRTITGSVQDPQGPRFQRDGSARHERGDAARDADGLQGCVHVHGCTGRRLRRRAALPGFTTFMSCVSVRKGVTSLLAIVLRAGGVNEVTRRPKTTSPRSLCRSGRGRAGARLGRPERARRSCRRCPRLNGRRSRRGLPAPPARAGVANAGCTPAALSPRSTAAIQHRGLRPHRRQSVPRRHGGSALDVLDRRRHRVVRQRAALPARRAAAAAGRGAHRGAGQLLPLRLPGAAQAARRSRSRPRSAGCPWNAEAPAGADRPAGARRSRDAQRARRATSSSWSTCRARWTTPNKLPLRASTALRCSSTQLRPRRPRRDRRLRRRERAWCCRRRRATDKQRDPRRRSTGSQAGGSTNGGAGHRARLPTSRRATSSSGGINRVILAHRRRLQRRRHRARASSTRLIEEKRESGVFLTVLGFGMGNLKDATMEKLADKGNGNYAYIDTLDEARKVLVERGRRHARHRSPRTSRSRSSSTRRRSRAYRLIGYENRAARATRTSTTTRRTPARSAPATR